jgi:hypothetical protein
MTPEVISGLKLNLYLILAGLTNRGVALWAIEKEILPLRTDQVAYSIEPGTVAVLNSTYVTPQQLTYTGNPTATFSDATAVSVVGLLPSVSSTPTIAFETSADSVTWTTVQTPGAITATAGQWSWYEIDPATPALYFRVSTTAGALTLTTLYLSNTVSEIPLYQLTRDDYAAMPNKRISGQPLQFWFDRQIPPVLHFWPMPTTATAFVKYWRQRQPMDVGDITNRLDLPAQWHNFLIHKLAASAILEIPGADISRLPTLTQLADRYEMEAENDETDHSPKTYLPNIRGYTR